MKLDTHHESLPEHDGGAAEDGLVEAVDVAESHHGVPGVLPADDHHPRLVRLRVQTRQTRGQRVGRRVDDWRLKESSFL